MWYRVMDEMDNNYGDFFGQLREAKKLAKQTAKDKKRWIWVINMDKDVEAAIYNEKGEEM